MDHLDHPSSPFQWCQNGAFLLLPTFIIALGGKEVIVPFYSVQDCSFFCRHSRTEIYIQPSFDQVIKLINHSVGGKTNKRDERITPQSTCLFRSPLAVFSISTNTDHVAVCYFTAGSMTFVRWKWRIHSLQKRCKLSWLESTWETGFMLTMIVPWSETGAITSVCTPVVLWAVTL